MQIEFKSRPEAFSLRSCKEWTLRKSTNSRSPLPFGNRNSGYALVPTQRFCNPCREYDSMWQNMPALVGAKGVSTLTQKTSQVISTTVSYCFHAMFPPLFASAQPCSSFHGQKMQRACISDPVMGSNWSAPRSFCQILPSELPSSASYLKELQLRAGTKIGKKKRTFGPCHVTKLCEFDGFYTACCCRGKGENTGMLDCVAVGSQASVWLWDQHVGIWRRICLRWIIWNRRVESIEASDSTALHEAGSPASTFRSTTILNGVERGIRHRLEEIWCTVGIFGMRDTTTHWWHVLEENWSESTVLSSQLMCFVLSIKHVHS